MILIDIKKYFYRKYQKCIERRIDKKNDGRLALMFHQVTNQTENWYNIQYTMSLESFKNMIAWCERNRYEIVSPEDILKFDGRKKILLTFDDVFREIYTEVFPYLQEKGYPFIIFPSVKLMEKKDYITLDMLREMSEYTGCYIGAHTISHCLLRKEDLIRCKEEIIKSKKFLEDYLHKPVEYMAYPYGTYYAVGKREKRIARENYKCAFSTLQTCIIKDVDRYFVPRINMNESNWEENLEDHKR